MCEGNPGFGSIAKVQHGQLGKRFGADAYCAEAVIAETAACLIGARARLECQFTEEQCTSNRRGAIRSKWCRVCMSRYKIKNSDWLSPGLRSAFDRRHQEPDERERLSKEIRAERELVRFARIYACGKPPPPTAVVLVRIYPGQWFHLAQSAGWLL